VIGGTYPTPLQVEVRVVDNLGNSAPAPEGTPVVFEVPTDDGPGGSFVSPSQDGAVLRPLSEVEEFTDANGVATVELPLQANQTPGQFTVGAHVGGTSFSAIFHLTNLDAIPPVPFAVTDPGDQENDEGDTVQLQIETTGGAAGVFP